MAPAPARSCACSRGRGAANVSLLFCHPGLAYNTGTGAARRAMWALFAPGAEPAAETRFNLVLSRSRHGRAKGGCGASTQAAGLLRVVLLKHRGMSPMAETWVRL